MTSTATVGHQPDVLVYDPGQQRVYVATESGWINVLDLKDRTLATVGSDHLANNAHVVAVDPTTHHSYYPCQPERTDTRPCWNENPSPDANSTGSALEAQLCSGMATDQAFGPHRRSTARTALLPVIDSTKVVGLISLPGAMTVAAAATGYLARRTLFDVPNHRLRTSHDLRRR